MIKDKTGIFVVLLALILISGYAIALAKSSNQNNIEIINELVFTIPLGKDGIHYAGEDHPDVFKWGPSAFTIAPNGTLWIADTPDDSLLQFSQKGELIAKIGIGEWVVGAGDIAVTQDNVWVLDIASVPPKLLQLTMEGQFLNSYDLPKGLYVEDGLTGFSISNNGDILIEREGGLYITKLVVSSKIFQFAQLDGYIFQDETYTAHPANIRTGTDKSLGYISAGNRHIAIEVEQDLGSLSILQIGTDGTLFVEVAEIVINESIQVDQKIYRYDLFGNLTGIARVPLADQYLSVAHSVAVASNNDVYVFVTKPDGGEIYRLLFYSSVSPILKAPNQVDTSAMIESSPGDCRYRSTIINTAAGYVNNSTYIDSYHINSSNTGCLTRLKPTYLDTARTYSSVPYDWGGWDSVAAFNNYMSGINNGMFAGDINTSMEGCSRGVDCSGLVSNAWNLGDHYGTCSLENVSTVLSSTSELKAGDIMNRCSTTPRHTIIFHTFGNYGQGQGMYGYESTTQNDHNRVVRTFRLFIDISTYTPRRYNNVCPDRIHLPLITRQIPIMMNLTNPYPGPESNPYPPPPNPYP